MKKGGWKFHIRFNQEYMIKLSTTWTQEIKGREGMKPQCQQWVFTGGGL